MIIIQDLKPTLNIQTDSVHTKLFYRDHMQISTTLD